MGHIVALLLFVPAVFVPPSLAGKTRATFLIHPRLDISLSISDTYFGERVKYKGSLSIE